MIINLVKEDLWKKYTIRGGKTFIEDVSRIQYNKRIKLAILGTPYECPEVIYWDSTYLSFAIRPTNSKLPTIHYDSTKRPKLSLEIPGCYISGYENINDYYNGIVAATNIISSLAELPLDELEHA